MRSHLLCIIVSRTLAEEDHGGQHVFWLCEGQVILRGLSRIAWLEEEMVPRAFRIGDRMT